MKSLRHLNRRFLLRYRIEYAAALFLVTVLRSASPKFAWRFMRALGRLFWRLGVRRKTVLRNLRVAFPDRSEEWREEIGRRNYEHFASMLVDILLQKRLLRWSNVDRRVTMTGWALGHMRKHGVAGWRRRSTRLIYLTGHFGNWELSASVFDVMGVPIAPIYRGPQNPWLAEMIKGIRLDAQAKYIEKRGAVRAMVRHLSDGGNIGFLFDQEAMTGVPVRFFGVEAPTHKTPAVLHLDHGFSFIFGTMIRRGDFLDYEMRGIRIDPPESTGDVKADRVAVMEDLSRRLEAAIREHPEQYLWGHRRWKRVGVHGDDLKREKKS